MPVDQPHWNGRVVTVWDGDEVVVGGSGGRVDSDYSGEDLLGRIDAVAPPAPACSLDPWWSVGALTK